MPSVEGLVIMTAAVSGPRRARNPSRSMPPSGAALIEIVRRPAIVAVAGFVPCAESGTSTSVRPVSPRDRWYSRIIRMPVSSPWAPAAGWSVTACMPLISRRICSSSHRSCSVPCAMSSGASGCSWANPGSRAAHSLTFGFHFIVHEPSG
jgi:hypothetical protein